MLELVIQVDIHLFTGPGHFVDQLQAIFLAFYDPIQALVFSLQEPVLLLRRIVLGLIFTGATHNAQSAHRTRVQL